MARRSDLIRTLERPKQITFVELFFDLVFVFSLFRLSVMLSGRLTWVGAFESVIVLMAIWGIWSCTNLLTDSLDSRTLPMQLLVIGSAYGVLILSAALPESFEQRGFLFAISYVAIHVGRSSMMAVALRHDQLGLRPLRAAIWFAIAGVLWIVGAMVWGKARLVIWTIAILIDYVAALFGWPVPGIGRTTGRQLNPASAHFAERYRQFIIIALGQTIVVTGEELHNHDFSPHRGSAATLSFIVSVLLFWIYFHRTREKLGPIFAGTKDPYVRNREAGLAHLLMVAGIVVVTTSDELAVTHPTTVASGVWVAVFIAGPVLFLAGNALLGRHVFAKFSIPRLVGAVVLLGVSPALVGQPALLLSGTVVVVLGGVVAWDFARTGTTFGDQDLPQAVTRPDGSGLG